MEQAIAGTRIRQRRRELGITQADLAKRVGISASYLNLIEWNKRRIAGGLLHRTAEALGLKAEELEGLAERRLQDALLEIAHLPALEELAVERGRVGELIGRFPGWSRGLATLARSEQQAVARARNLSDRLSNDPILSEAVHRMLTRIASIRSAAEILVDYQDIEPERRDRFNEMIHEESGALSSVAEALASYLDSNDDDDRILTPIDEVESLFESRENRFEELDEAALAIEMGTTETRPLSRQRRAEDLVKAELGGLIETLVSAQPQLKTASARVRAVRSLSQYAIGSVLMPSRQFAEEAQSCRYDVEALADTFSADIELVCHRLTALPRSEGTPVFGYYQANAAGTIIEMLGLKGLALLRYAAACPLWALYRAQQTPETVILQRALFPNGSRYVFLARARQAGRSGFGKPRHYLANMIAMTEADAQHTVYAPNPSALVEEVGPGCRICARVSCIHRVEDPLTE